MRRTYVRRSDESNCSNAAVGEFLRRHESFACEECMPLKIENYALIGDLHSAALVGNDGSIDWLCLPRFDSGACFCGLLGEDKNGHFRIAPADPILRSNRRYLPDTLVVETEFETATGVVRLIDFMPPRTRQPDVVRIVTGIRGRVKVELRCVIRFDYGKIIPWVTHTDRGIRAVAGPDCLELTSPVPLHGEDLQTVAEFEISAQQRLPFVLTWFPSHQVELPPPIDPEQALEHTLAFWRRWAGHCTYQGPYREAVVRSLITLKALTYAPTGGLVAAATSSLPEHWGGQRNWDYRFCWLRDATFTLYALVNAGYAEEAHAWCEWLLRAVAGEPSQMQIMYGIAGERRLNELELPWLPGYENSKPVRIGNAAYGQLQLDVFGEIMDMLHAGIRVGITPTPTIWELQRLLLDRLGTLWQEPDEGIWETRGPRRHFTYSKIMAWVAFDRGIKMAERFSLTAPLSHWRTQRKAIHADVCNHGFNPDIGAFTQYYGSNTLDASLLAIPHLGFLRITDPRVRSTIAAIQEGLDMGGLIMRYKTEDADDGMPPGEGAFLLCSFWMADNFFLMGQRTAAKRLFERLLSLRNDVGLLSEQYDPIRKRMLGNFPQAFSHVALINTAYNLRSRPGPARERPMD
jgi:GH15 family glucan-1,4-alpha-glucosidase